MSDIAFFNVESEALLRIVVVGSLAYFSLIILLRISGKRTLAQLNAFDFIITVAIGSTLGRLMTAKNVSLAESITAFFTLISLQYLVSWITVRSETFNYLVTTTPKLLYFRDRFLYKAMQEQRVSKAQLLAVVRNNRIGSLQEVDAIVMESAGTITVIKQSTIHSSKEASTLQDIPEYPSAAK